MVSTRTKLPTKEADKLTNCSRGIRNAWHFYYALIFLIKVVCGGIGIALLTP
ncbi:DUF3265 domain-containing protein [Vibrio parahaemolyticus]|nr:DUF3265 domain-containing protein [Vibrio parahaemolyticus]QIR90073.1 DUF3265 domain-containing protein [Vibrio diabolicus]MBE3862233.1 DUF3265 domain-containing protein [Vibrio parahaemolyticus]MBE4048750.1 DUF3265 domain-containing protein [Vibrio parahaemolyticus]MBM5068800.1 DUF3265 domain-containing protein [Vibrio parahaemolyticus]